MKINIYYISLIVFFKLTFSIAQPVANFNADKISGCAPLAVQFTNLSTSGASATWSWDFGNGNTSTQQNPGAFYNNAGVYTVRLTVTDASGSNTLTKTAYITVYSKPIANFTTPDTLTCTSNVIDFTDLSVSTAPLNSWYWSFGDGATSQLQNPTHTYAPGNYTVFLTVTDTNGCTGYRIKNNYIKITDVKSNFNFNSISCPAPSTVSFTNLSTGTGLSYNWTFGDGSNSTQQNPTHTYTAYDTFSVKLVVKDPSGCKDSLTKNMYVVQMKTNFTYTVTCTDSNYTLNFTDLTFPTPSAWNWNFGDGSTSNQKNPSHTYSNNQSYNIKLTTGLGASCNDNTTKTYTVTQPLFTNDTVSCRSPFIINFTNNSIGDSLTYLWNFGSTDTSTIKNPVYSFTTGNLFDQIPIRLSATDKYGCTRSVESIAHIKKPLVNFSAEEEEREGCIPLTTNFTDKSESPDTIVGWKWDFGNGTSSTLQNPVATFADTGHFSIKLVVTTMSGCTDSLILTNYIRAGIKPVTLNFTDYDTLCYHNGKNWFGTAVFSDTSIRANTWYWEFPMHPLPYRNEYYVQNPHFNVKDNWGIGYFPILMVAGYNGCVDSIVKYPVTVGPVSQIREDSTSWAFCSSPAVVNIQNKSTLYTQMYSFYTLDLSTSQILEHLNSDTLFTNIVTFHKAGRYGLVVTSHNDTTRSGGGCTDQFPDFVIVVDSMVQKFSISEKEVCLAKNKGNIISFADSSKSFYGNLSYWKWDFGDGTTLEGGGVKIPSGYRDTITVVYGGDDPVHPNHSSGGLTSGTYKNPTHLYTDTGTYVVKQIIASQLVWQRNGRIHDDAYCSSVKYDTIRIRSVFPEFSSDKAGICPGSTVSFFDSTVTNSSNVTNWQWNFGDGLTSNQQNPTHSYPDTGRYDIRLIATDAFGCTDTIVKDEYISVTKPVAKFAIASANGCTNQSVRFTNSSTGIALTYLWEFGDGTTDSIANPQHIFNTQGTYNITLTVTDSNGCDSTITKNNSLTIYNKPTAKFSADSVYKKCPPLTVTFADSSSNNIQSWLWNFGNGNTSTLANPVHVYAVSGSYDVSLIVTNNRGCKDTLIRSPYITLGGPSGSFVFYPDSICAPAAVTFVANAINTNSYWWDFGDGTTITNAPDSIVYVYTNDTTYTPSLILIDNNNECKVPLTAGVLFVNGIDADFNASDFDLCNTDNVSFSNTTTVNSTTNFVWDFGDGDTATTVNANHTFTNIGTYTVTLHANEVAGCSSSVSKTVSVLQKPTIEIGGSGLDGCVPYNIALQASKVNTNSTTIDSWLWNFGNNDTTSANPATHTYTTNGTHVINLTAYYGGNCFIDTSIAVTTHLGPIADFLFQPDSIVPYGSEIRFFGIAPTAKQWHWNFGNGDSSDVQNPAQIYKEGGMYTVTLVALDEYGCPDTVRKSVLISPHIPNVFTPNGDGINDNFYISGVETQKCTFMVYNRWGDVVFESNNYQNDWYGQAQNGNSLSDGVYFYHIRCDYIYHTKGWVQILSSK